MLDLDSLVEELERERKEFVRIIGEIYSGNISVVNELDPSVFTPRNQRLFLLTANEMKHRRRNNGKPYFVHPASAAYLLSLFLDKNHPDREKAIAFALTHDLLEDGWYYKKQVFNERKSIFLPEYEEELYAAVLLTEPVSRDYIVDWEPTSPIGEVTREPFLREDGTDKVFSYPHGSVMRFATSYQVTRFGNNAHFYAHVAEKLDNQLDIAYTEGYDEEKRQNTILRFVLPTLFLVEEYPSSVPEFVGPVRSLSEQMRQRYGITQADLQSRLVEFKDIKEMFKMSTLPLMDPQLIIAIERHLTRYDFPVPPDKLLYVKPNG
jgi:hypothetical protein